ncbi:MAG: CpsD/CapB family tyrosine-protein kinase [Candidatus Schekmanbacteria bacterium]|nr:CpsD/CapB family tyrosine-protein kinase [Candidatus Schekmanbacteria bacterium]
MSRIEQALAKAAAERKRTPGKLHGFDDDPIHSKQLELTPEMLYGMDPRIIALFGGASAAAEQYKQLRTKLLRAKKLYSHNTVMVTSSLPAEGKTTTSASLAITIAQGLQETVLLIDADMRKPGIQRALGIDPQHPGLADFLSGRITLEKAIVKTPLPKLSVIPAGSIPGNPSELISSEKMSSLITEAKNRYRDRIIIFDSPPVLSLTDSIALGQKVDEVILVVYAGRTPKEAVKDAVQSLSEVNLMGILLNHFDTLPLYYGKYKLKRSYGYGYGYGHGHGHGYGHGYGQSGHKPEEKDY